MNLNTEKVFFDKVKSDFLNNDGKAFDEEIKDVVLRWKNSPVLNKICPRWSCQSHGYELWYAQYYITFCTQDDGADILYAMFKELMKMDGVDYIPNWTYKISYLSLTEVQEAQPNITIGRTCRGNIDAINKTKSLWMKLLTIIEETYGE